MSSKDKEIEYNTIVITGCAGFIGGALTLHLIETTSATIIGIDNMNDYYDVSLKEYRLNRIREKDDADRFVFIKSDISDKQNMFDIFEKYRPDIVVHLAAQAGVRYSIENPDVYIQSNIVGFFNMIEACRYCKEKLDSPIKHFLFASSSSVYGNNEKIPYSEEDNTDHPVSLYAATKKADEALAYSYAKLYGIPMTGMRFFTVYGPVGRPDMAYYKFAERLISDEKIDIYNEGKNRRDFTYIDDVVDAIGRIMMSHPDYDKNCSPYNMYNIGNNNPIGTLHFLKVLVDTLKNNGLVSNDFILDEHILLCGAAPGDVETTFADVERLERDFGVAPIVSIKDGLDSFAKWFSLYYERK